MNSHRSVRYRNSKTHRNRESGASPSVARGTVNSRRNRDEVGAWGHLRIWSRSLPSVSPNAASEPSRRRVNSVSWSKEEFLGRSAADLVPGNPIIVVDVYSLDRGVVVSVGGEALSPEVRTLTGGPWKRSTVSVRRRSQAPPALSPETP